MPKHDVSHYCTLLLATRLHQPAFFIIFLVATCMFDDKAIMLDGFSMFFSIFHHHFKRGAARPPAASSCLQDTEHAVATATDALNAASAGIEDIPEESRNDASRAKFVAQ